MKNDKYIYQKDEATVSSLNSDVDLLKGSNHTVSQADQPY